MFALRIFRRHAPRLLALVCAALVLVTHAHCAQEWGGRISQAVRRLQRPAEPAPAEQPARGCQHIGCLCQGAVTAAPVAAPESAAAAALEFFALPTLAAAPGPEVAGCSVPAFRPLHASTAAALRAWLGAFLA